MTWQPAERRLSMSLRKSAAQTPELPLFALENVSIALYGASGSSGIGAPCQTAMTHAAAISFSPRARSRVCQGTVSYSQFGIGPLFAKQVSPFEPFYPIPNAIF